MLRAAPFAVLAVTVAACSLKADPDAPYTPSPLGPGSRIAEVQNPSSMGYAPNRNVDVSSVVVSWIDTYDETRDGKSRGTVYIQDIGSQAPYSGLSMYQASFVPADLRLLPGDVMDVVGVYSESTGIGSTMFNAPETLPQFTKPVATFRYEFQSPTPVVVDLKDLDEHVDSSNYAAGRKWENMLVTVKDVTLAGGETDTTGNRVSYYLIPSGATTVDLNACAMSNELYPLGKMDYPAGTHFSSVTGIVTWFFSYQIAPRSAADLQQ